MSETFKERLVRHIEMSGPMPLAEFMHWAMADPKQGYYATRQPIGKEGDFITAPEISQMFGEMIGIWAISAWQSLDKPETFNLVEIGPGRGTLMKDLLRTAKNSPEFLKAAHICLVETSESLREEQRVTLGKGDSSDRIEWYKSVKDLASRPSIIIANELLDALPVRQFVKNGDKWCERAIGLNDDGALIWVITDNAIEPTSLPQNHDQEPDGSVFEISSIRESFIANSATHLKENSGVALFIDYGHMKTGFGDTFQAMRRHKYVDPLDHLNEADLTSHVDFEALKDTAKSSDMHCHPLLTQGEFLLKLGLLERAGKLGSDKDQSVQERLTQEAERLALPDQMGDLFKCFAFSDRELSLFPFDNA